MKIYFLIVFFLFFLLPEALNAVTISGTDSTYIGTEVLFNTYSDQISGSEKVVGTALVDSAGRFSLTFDTKNTLFVFSYLGVYKVHLYAEPGMQYEIILPPRQEKSPADMLNPYFSPVIVHLGTTQQDKSELNTLIRMFNDAYLPYFNKHVQDIALKEDFSELDNDIKNIEKPFSSSENEFFNTYRSYRYGMLRYLAWQKLSKKTSDEFFLSKPLAVNNPAYMDLFNKVYDNYFHHVSRRIDPGKLGRVIQSQHIDSLRQIIASDQVVGSGELAELIILKFIHDEFYDDNFSRTSLLALLDSYVSEGAQNEELKEIALSIRNKVTRLLSGFPPPEFNLYNRDSTLVNLANFRGKYVYLSFCSCFSYTCLNEFAQLAKLYDKHKNLMEIVTIIVDNDKDIINSFLQRSGYKWTFLHYGNQSSVMRDYDIRAFPTYYLIDREGKLAISPAPGPGEDFEARFFTLLRSRGEL